MIAIDIECSQGHIFEGWFDTLDSFEDQKARELVRCPYCEDPHVRRVISPVRVRRSSPAPDRLPGPLGYERLAKEVVDYVLKNSEDVGPRFAAEALKIHYGVTEKRSIRGSATEQEENVLKQEGIDFIKIPLPKTEPEKNN